VGGTVLKARKKWGRNKKPPARSAEVWASKDIKRRRWPLALRIGEVMLFVVFVAILIQRRHHPGLLAQLPVRGGIGISILFITHMLVKRHLERDLETLDTPRFARTEVDPRNAAILLKRAGNSRYSYEQAKLFALAVTTPAAVRQRVVDTFDPGGRSLNQRVTLEIQAPPELLQESRLGSTSGRPARPTFFIPIIIPKKGKMLDNFHLKDASDTQMSVLSYREYLDLAAGVLWVLFKQLEQAAPDTRRKEFQHAERAAVQAIIRRHADEKGTSGHADGPLGKQFSLRLLRDWRIRIRLWKSGSVGPRSAPHDARAEDPAWKLIEDLPLQPGTQSEPLKATIAAFVKILSESYCVAAAVELDDQLRALLTYEQTLIPDLDLSNSSLPWIASFIGRLRIAMGTRPPTLTLAISNAFTCQSYHLRVGIGDNLYVTKQVPIEFRSLVSRIAPGAPTVAHMRFQRRLGQPHAHFYARYMPEPDAAHDVQTTRTVGSATASGPHNGTMTSGDDRTVNTEAGEERMCESCAQQLPASPEPSPVPVPRIRFVFAEVPPGSLVRATVAAVSAAATIWLIAFLNKFGRMDTDAPAYLLTFPAAIAAWMGFESQAGKRIEGTLRARMVLLVTALTSIAASGLFVAHKSVDAKHWPLLPRGLSLLGVTDLWWSILVLLSIANAVYIGYKYYVLTLQFTIHSTREQPGNSFTQHG
jgi:hypothetical protein